MNIKLRTAVLAATTLGATLIMSTNHADPAYPGYGSGPGMWQQMNPEQRQQAWENMQRWGYGPGMMGPGMMGPGMMGPGMMGPGMMGQGYPQPMTPQQYQQWWEQMHQRGYGPGMMHQLTPEQSRQMWEQMHQRGYGPWWMQPPASSTPPAK